jgi:hypothetical protein
MEWQKAELYPCGGRTTAGSRTGVPLVLCTVKVDQPSQAVVKWGLDNDFHGDT